VTAAEYLYLRQTFLHSLPLGAILHSLKKDQNHTAIKLSGFSQSPEEISERLGLTPTRSWLKGEEYYRGHGEHRISKVREENFWELNWYRETEQWIQGQVDEFLSVVVNPRKEIIKEMSKECYCEFSVAQYVYDGCNPGFHFSKDALALIHYIGAELDLDIYCLADSENQSYAPNTGLPK
jgi:hypothetical protein